MFTWVGVLDRFAYAWRAAITIALLVGTVLLFPFLTRAIVSASHCQLDTCGAIALVVPSALRPILFIVAMAAALSVCVRRARDAGLPPWLGALPPLMFIADQSFLQYAGAGWAYPFSAGILAFHLPVFALFGMTLMALLVIPSRDSLRDGWDSLFIGPVAPTAPAAPSSAAVAASETLSLWRPGRAAAIGAAIAFAVVLYSLQRSIETNSVVMLLIAFASSLMSAFVLTFFLYTALTAAAMRFIARRDAIGAAALVVAMIPFGFWTASLYSVRMAKARETAAVAAIPKVALPATIRAVVIEGEEWPHINCARVRVLSGDYGFDDILTHGQSKSPYLRFTRATAKAPLQKGIGVDAAPAEYVLIRFPRRPPYFADRVLVDIAFPPLEIYAVNAAGSQLVAASYTAYNPPPAFPPMLMSQGWYRGDTPTTYEKSCKNIDAFIQRELLDKLPATRS